MMFTDVMINPIDTSFQEAEVPFSGIGVDITANIFAFTVLNNLVFYKVLIQPPVGYEFTGHHRSNFFNVVFNERGLYLKVPKEG